MSNVSDPNGQNRTTEPGEKEADLQTVPELPSYLETKAKVLKTVYGWTSDRARGYVDGVACRVRGARPSKYVLVGIDEYALGFRVGYYNR